MYADIETGKSSGYLEKLLKDKPEKFCLIGGWAVYHTVTAEYKRSTGRRYLGSRDIDIGVKNTDTLLEMEQYLRGELGFRRLSFRYVKYLDYDTGLPVPPELARTTPLHLLFELYVDMMIPRYSNDIKDVLGFIPPDEPILEKVFDDHGGSAAVRIGKQVAVVPSPHLLLAMKLNSVGNRTKDHKRVKDICDIVALCLFSGRDRDELIGQGISNADPERIKALEIGDFEEDMDPVAGILGIQEDAVRSLTKKFV